MRTLLIWPNIMFEFLQQNINSEKKTFSNFD
jgi:hypothetical protein